MSGATPDTTPPQPASFPNRDVQVETILWTLWALTVPFMVARFYVRIKRSKLGLDDWCMLVAWVIFTGCAIASEVALKLGSFHHIASIVPDFRRLDSITLSDLCTEAFTAISYPFAKASVAILLQRILDSTRARSRLVLNIHIIIYAILSSATIPLLFVGCHPIEAAWHPELIAMGAGDCSAKNVALTGLQIAATAFGAYFDFLLAIFPTVIIYNLQAPLKRKITLCVLLGLSLFTGASAIVKTIQFQRFNLSTDPTWDSYGLFIWSAIELFCVIVCGSVPVCFPLWDYFWYGKPIDNERRNKSRRALWPGLISLTKSLRTTSVHTPDASMDQKYALTDKSHSVYVHREVEVTRSATQPGSESYSMVGDRRWASRGSD